MVRSVLSVIGIVALAAVLAGSAGAAARGSRAEADAPAAPTAPAEPADGGAPPPADVASLDPIEECASVAPRVEKIRQLPAMRAPEHLLRRPRARRAQPPLAPREPGCAEVARWCLAHATSTSIP